MAYPFLLQVFEDHDNGLISKTKEFKTLIKNIDLFENKNKITRNREFKEYLSAEKEKLLEYNDFIDKKMEQQEGIRHSLLFFGKYFSNMAIYALIWYYLPTVAIIIFIACNRIINITFTI